ncbi:hypothetical protein AB0C21_40085 [Spirillospora sp. NPDC049024]
MGERLLHSDGCGDDLDESLSAVLEAFVDRVGMLLAHTVLR